MKNEMAGMEQQYSRRSFCRTMGLGLGAAMLAVPGLQAADAPKRRLIIGHTGITWGNNIPQAIKDLGGLGYQGFETFDNVLQRFDSQGAGLAPLLEEAKLPLISGYCGVNLKISDPEKRKAEVEKLVRVGNVIKKLGGSVAVIGPDGRGQNYVFNDHKADIIATLNDVCQALADIGIIGALHQHTGTSVEKRDEVYAVLEGVNTKYVRFGPDVGQLAKGGADPVEIVKHFSDLIAHVHLKDWDGGPYWVEYCPLGKGKVNLPEILDLLEKSAIKKIIMVELDGSRNAPIQPLETATIAKAYLEKQGYTFRSV
jgi:inosose dehydratase